MLQGRRKVHGVVGGHQQAVFIVGNIIKKCRRPKVTKIDFNYVRRIKCIITHIGRIGFNGLLVSGLRGFGTFSVLCKVFLSGASLHI